MLRYEHATNFDGLKVLLNGEHAGTIKPVLNGWRYYPKGSKKGGEVFPSLTACKRSLEPPAVRDASSLPNPFGG